MGYILDTIHELLAPCAGLVAGAYAYFFLSMENEDDVFLARAAYAVSTGFVAMMYGLIMMVRGRDGNQAEEIITLRNGGKTSHVPVKQYDVDQAQSALIWLALEAVVVALMHVKLEFLVPLAVQSIVNPILLLQSSIFNVCILNRRAAGHLRRPWDNESLITVIKTMNFKKIKRQIEEMQSEMAGEKVKRKITARERKNKNLVARRKK
mmetsp:Transcript_505/g.758  ORF Transcript_505/g.758 Transcript_505/m.758 type:complete len:208 (-) Transcript_505:47-670(-)